MEQYWPPNKEQVSGIIRYLVSAFGLVFATWLASRINVSADQIMTLITDPTVQLIVAGAGVSVATLIQSLFAKTEKNQVAAVEQLPNVQQVITQPTEAGQKLAASILTPMVVSASDVKITDIPPPPVKDKG